MYNSSATAGSPQYYCKQCQAENGEFCSRGILLPMPGFWNSYPNAPDIQVGYLEVACGLVRCRLAA